MNDLLKHFQGQTDGRTFSEETLPAFKFFWLHRIFDESGVCIESRLEASTIDTLETDLEGLTLERMNGIVPIFTPVEHHND